MGVRRYQTNPKRVLAIQSSMVDLHVHRDSRSKIIKEFSFLGLDISTLYGAGKIPKNAKIILEIRNNNDFQREDLGTLISPQKVRNKLIELSNPQGLTFHVFVKDGFDILASNEHVKPKDDDAGADRQGLLVVEPSSDLGQIVWRVSPVDGSTEPKLLINSSKELDIMRKLYTRDETWISIIFPNALEQILYIFASNQDQCKDDSESWISKWENFFDYENIDLDADFGDPVETRDWVEDVVAIIAERGQFITNLINKYNSND